MNQVQRKYLIDKIKATVNEKISALQGERMEYPSPSNYLFHAIMKDELKLQPQEKIIAVLKKKALNAKEGANWLSEERMGFDKERTVKLDITDLIDIPAEYRLKVEEAKKHNNEIAEKISVLKIQLETLETRIQLASDKTLQKMISEVDDMGDISLMDTKIKYLSQ